MTRYGEHVSVFHKIQKPSAEQIIVSVAIYLPAFCLFITALLGAAFLIHPFAR